MNNVVDWFAFVSLLQQKLIGWKEVHEQMAWACRLAETSFFPDARGCFAKLSYFGHDAFAYRV